MTKDKELIEVWRAEFRELSPFHENYMSMDDGVYEKMAVEAYWQGFLLAKRAQPSVVLPRERWADNIGETVFIDDELKAALTAAGIKYTIGE